MPKLFDTAFAANGDKTPIPNIVQSDGSLSYPQGFGPDYEKDPLEASSKPVPRTSTNQALFDITDAVGDIQRHGFPTWSPDAGVLIGGYAKRAIVWFAADSWQSQIDGNTTTPGPDEIAWLSSAKYQGGGGGTGSGGFGLIGPTTVNVGGSYSYTIDPYNSFLSYTVSATRGTATISGSTITLVIASGETSNVTDLTVTRSDGGTNSFRIAIGAQSIAKPSILSPTQGSIDVPLGPTLVGSAFATYPNGADTHLNTDWRIRTTGGTVVWSSMANSTNKTTIQVPDNSLPLNSQLTVDVRYRGTTLPVSDWSTAVTFTTTNQTIATPTITSPLNGATGVNGTPTFTSSAFATNPAGADTHASSDWRLKNSTGTVIWSSISDAVNKTSIDLPSGVLSVNSQYTIEVRYNGKTLQPSQWSPVVSFTTASAFDYGKYMVLGVGQDPRLPIYGQDIDTFTRLPNPAYLPTAIVRAVAFSPNGLFMSCGVSADPFHIMYKRSGDTFALYSFPSQRNSVPSISWSPDSTYYAIGQGQSPYLRCFKLTNDVFNEIAAPSTMPTAACNSVSFSGTGAYLAFLSNGTTKLIVYKRSADVLTAVSTIADQPAGNPIRGCFSSDDTYLAVASNGAPYVTIYKRSGDTFTKLANPAELPTGAASGAAFTTGAGHLAIVHAGAPYVTIYKRSGDTFTKLANPANLPTAEAVSVAFTKDTNQLMLGATASPFIFIYRRSGDVFSKLANPASLPSTNPNGIAVFPPTLGV